MWIYKGDSESWPVISSVLLEFKRFSVYVNFLIYVSIVVNTSWNILVLNSVLYSVHRWIYFSLFYLEGTKSLALMRSLLIIHRSR